MLLVALDPLCNVSHHRFRDVFWLVILGGGAFAFAGDEQMIELGIQFERYIGLRAEVPRPGSTELPADARSFNAGIAAPFSPNPAWNKHSPRSKTRTTACRPDCKSFSTVLVMTPIAPST
jgi:hypothetical protein